MERNTKIVFGLGPQTYAIGIKSKHELFKIS